MRTLHHYLILAALLSLLACGSERADESESSETLTTRSEKASLETPPAAAAGSSFQVSWTGPDNKSDYVTIVGKGAPMGSYLSYAYTRGGSPLVLAASDTPGEYEIRYVDGESKNILVSAPLSLTEVHASLEIPSEMGAGSTFQVSWTGPDNKSDYVTIVEKGAAQGSYGSYVYTRNGNPLELTTEETPGDYEVRYVMGQSKRTLARKAITLEPVEASLTVPGEAMVDSQVEVSWMGPDNRKDYITIVESGAPQGNYGKYTYTREGSALTVASPEKPGVYEVRYVMAQSKRILANQKITVKPLSASLEAPAQTTVNASLEVNWTGPNNPKDFIAIAQAGAAVSSYESRAYSRAGNPATLFTPSTPSEYQLRYVLAKSSRLLAVRPIQVAGSETSN